DALERITIPQDVLDRIAPTALPRSSIVISDEPLSRETNYRTEFVTVLSNQPQGGFITRKPTAPPVVASEGDMFGSFFQRSWSPQNSQGDSPRGYDPQGGQPAGPQSGYVRRRSNGLFFPQAQQGW